jgi:hypothetical protein
VTIKTLVQKFLAKHPHKVGETVKFGWFIFGIAGLGNPPRVESLDFRKMGSFSDDFSEAERIHSLQNAALVEAGVTECPCTLQQFALVSASYSPDRKDAFLERQETAEGNDSGWYVGVFDESLDMEDLASFSQRSLYELTIKDLRMAPFWLLPPGTIVSLADGIIQTEQP